MMNDDDCGFICYFREGTKASMPDYTQDGKETSVAEFSVGRLKSHSKRHRKEKHEMNLQEQLYET